MAKEFTGSESNIVALYHLEDVTDSVASYDLTNNGSATFTSAKFSNGVNLGSSNSSKYLSIANNLGWTGGDWTVVTWVKLLAEISSGTWTFIFHENSTSDELITISYEYNGGTRRIKFAVNGFGAGSASSTVYHNVDMGTSDFYMLGNTFNNGTGTVTGYVNGSSVGTDTGASGGSTGLNNNFHIGYWNAEGYASALIDETAVFSDEKSEVFINSYYTTNKKFFEIL